MPVSIITQPTAECMHVDEARAHRRIDDHADDAMLKSLIAAARQAAETKTRRQFMHARWQLTLDTFPAYGVASIVPAGASVSIPPYAIRIPHVPLVAVEKIEYLDMSGAWQTMSPSDYVVSTHLEPAIITPGFGKIWPIPLPQIASVKVTYTAGYASPITTGGALATNQFKVSGPVQWAVGDVVQFYNSGGVMPAPLCDGVNYTIASAAGGIYSLNDDAGNAVTFSQAGTGRTYIGVVPDGLRSWMLLRVGALYENREEVAVGTRIVVLELPFVDGLLDPFMVLN